tara:strand:+ start:739 stop:2073 length:1335 start_codon:yes stop_codon:yes gene_type:complete
MKKQNDYFKKIEKGTLEDAVEQIWNPDSKEEQLDEVVTNYKLLAKDIKKEFQQQLRKKKFLTLNDIESYVMSNADSPHKVETDEIVKELKKLRITVAGKFPHTREEVTSKQLQKAIGKAKGMKVKHDCATKVEHAEWGKGNPLKEQHTLDEDGTVTHYDVMFEHGLEKDVSVSTLKILASAMHEHAINPDKNDLQEMNPTDHVKKKGDKFCVYNADGTIAKEFDNREDAEKYAIANHDKLMATKKEEVEIDEGTKYIGRAGEGTQFQVVYTNKKRRDGIYRLEKDRTLGKIYNQREAEKMVKKLSADKRNSDFEYRFVPKGNINHRSGEVVTPVDFYKVGFKNRREQVTSPSKYIDILTKFQEETEYQKFFKSAMKKFGVKSPSELDGDKEKEFYDYVDKNWKGKNEPKEVGEKRKPNGKTLTGKPKDNIDVNPKTSDIKAGKY